jgi:hypothetical protein
MAANTWPVMADPARGRRRDVSFGSHNLTAGKLRKMAPILIREFHEECSE